MKCRTGGGRISACGGDGFAGGGGGRVSVDVFSRHDDPEIFVHGRTYYVFVSCINFGLMKLINNTHLPCSKLIYVILISA